MILSEGGLRLLLLTAVAGAALVAAAPANAADLGQKPAYKAPPAASPMPLITWTGCYIGGNVGAGWTEKSIVDQEPSLQGVLRDKHRSSGFVGGGQIGCDYQVNTWVFGIQGMFDGADITGTHFDFANPDLIWHSKNSWFATLTGRIGYLVQPAALLYAKA